MKINLTKSLSVIVSRPIQFISNSEPQLELFLEKDHRVIIPNLPKGFRLTVYSPEKESGLYNLLNRAGIGLSKDELRMALTTCLPDGCFIVEDDSGNVISSMMARHINSNDRLFSGRIDWLATDPDFNGLGLGTISASAAAKRLQDAGYDDIWVTTDDHRLGAVKVFYNIGFRPYIYDEIETRWEKILQTLKLV